MLVAQGNTVNDFPGFLLTLQGLGVGQVRLACEGTCPDQAVTEKVSVEKFPAMVQGNKHITTRYKVDIIRLCKDIHGTCCKR